MSRKEIRDGTGRLQKVEIRTPDKEVEINFLNGFWAKVFGKTIVCSLPDSVRWDINSDIRKINKDKSLSGKEKQRQKREIVANYRDCCFTLAPNKKVHFALKTRYLAREI